MSQKIMIVVGAPRKGGNSMLIAKKIAEGARAAGKEVAMVELARLRGFGQGCISCFACQHSKEYRCATPDEVSPVLEAMKNYDTVVLAAPIYFFGIAAQMKAFIDRFYCQVKYDGAQLVSPLSKLNFALAITAGDTLAGSGAQTFVDAMTLLTGYTGGAAPRVLFTGGCGENVGALQKRTDALDAAVAFGADL